MRGIGTNARTGTSSVMVFHKLFLIGLTFPFLFLLLIAFIMPAPSIGYDIDMHIVVQDVQTGEQFQFEPETETETKTETKTESLPLPLPKEAETVPDEEQSTPIASSVDYRDTFRGRKGEGRNEYGTEAINRINPDPTKQTEMETEAEEIFRDEHLEFIQDRIIPGTILVPPPSYADNDIVTNSEIDAEMDTDTDTDTDINASYETNIFTREHEHLRTPTPPSRSRSSHKEQEQEVQQQQQQQFDRYIIKYKNETSFRRARRRLKSGMDTSTDNANANATGTPIMEIEKERIQVVTLRTTDEIEEWEALDDVQYVEKDHKVFLSQHSHPHPHPHPHRNLQRLPTSQTVPYGIHQVHALAVSDDHIHNRKVCIIDSGYDTTHPDLQSDSQYVSGSSSITNDDRFNNDDDESESKSGWSVDECGHGTHIAGTISAMHDDQAGIIGINRSGRLNLHIVKTFTSTINNNKCSWAWASTLISAMYECMDAGSDVINLSLGYEVSSRYEREAFESMESMNVLVVAAAGNDGTTAYNYPASYSSVLSVGAVNSRGMHASFSQRNDEVDLVAPGDKIVSTFPGAGGGYLYQTGTSMACAHVTGVAALVWSHFPHRTAMEIKSALTESARQSQQSGPTERDDKYGYGIVDAHAAYAYLRRLEQEEEDGDGDRPRIPTYAPSDTIPIPSCGNGQCNVHSLETCSSCPQDCAFMKNCNYIGSPGVSYFSGDWHGVSFSLRALNDVYFYEMDVYMHSSTSAATSTSVRVVVYTREGSYMQKNTGSVFDEQEEPRDLTQWDVVFDGHVPTKRSKVTVPIVNPIFTKKETERSFYFSFEKGYSITFRSFQQPYGVASRNDDIILYLGEAQGGSFGKGILNYVPFGGMLRYTIAPGSTPSPTPSIIPSLKQSLSTTPSLSSVPTYQPSIVKSSEPSVSLSSLPSRFPTSIPTKLESSSPSSKPSRSQVPSAFNSAMPSLDPTSIPTTSPSNQPSLVPTFFPSVVESSMPSSKPSISQAPSRFLSTTPTINPTSFPTMEPSSEPIEFPTLQPTTLRSERPSTKPSISIMPSLSASPTNQPSTFPSKIRSLAPSVSHSNIPTEFPTLTPTLRRSSLPSSKPSSLQAPSPSHSTTPSVGLTPDPTLHHSNGPSKISTLRPTESGSLSPTSRPQPISSSKEPSFKTSISSSKEPRLTAKER